MRICSPKVGFGPMLQAAGIGAGRPVDEGQDGVDAVVGDDGVDPVEVGRRDADARPPAGAVGDEAADPVGSAEEPGGLGGLALGQGPADPGRGDDPAVVLGRGGDLEVEPGLGAPGAEERGVAPRSRPKPKVGPSTIPRAPSWPRITRSKNSRAVRPRSQGPVRKTPTSVAPAAFISSSRRSIQVSGAGAASGRSTATGGGSKVRARAGTPAASARARSRARRCACPRWTPSKLPTATNAPRASRGDLREVFERDHRPRPPAPARSGRSRLRRPRAARPGLSPRPARPGQSRDAAPGRLRF